MEALGALTGIFLFFSIPLSLTVMIVFFVMAKNVSTIVFILRNIHKQNKEIKTLLSIKQ